MSFLTEKFDSIRKNTNFEGIKKIALIAATAVGVNFVLPNQQAMAQSYRPSTTDPMVENIRFSAPQKTYTADNYVRSLENQFISNRISIKPSKTESRRNTNRPTRVRVNRNNLNEMGTSSGVRQYIGQDGNTYFEYYIIDKNGKRRITSDRGF
jgi:hypothetical protein